MSPATIQGREGSGEGPEPAAFCAAPSAEALPGEPLPLPYITNQGGETFYILFNNANGKHGISEEIPN